MAVTFFNRRPGTYLVLIGGLACGNGAGPELEAPCPAPQGEFPPTDCAYVEGRLSLSGGSPAAGRGVRVDSFVRSFGYAYVSDAVAADGEGRFQLLVFRINRFEAPTVPDVATISVRLYSDAAAARPGAPPEASTAVPMSFAPMGAVVDTTRVEIVAP